MSVVDFADIVLAALERRASDIHLTAGAAPSIRVRGRLFALEGFPVLGVSDTREIVYSIMSDTQRQQFENARQVDFSYSVPRTARMRVNAYLQRGAVSAALRVIPSVIQSLESLGMPPAVREMASLPRGMVLVTGPTGSGKSTTLAAVIDEINNTREDHILTIEDPIEFLHQHKRCLVNQRELGSDATSFSEGLRAALREDPDVILVGEMRDLETISTALTAAETGHLVLATLHTQDAPQTIDRIIDVFPPHQQQHVRVMLSVALQGVVAQQLMPTADGSGRVPAVEVLIPTPAVRNLIREGKTHQIYSAIQTGGEYGMQTMDAALAELVRAGRITRDVAQRRASVPTELARLLGGGGAVLQAAGGNGYLQ
ncbi:MAG TPA: type IV pilus twitching motility protein PilT [Solirubrobacteraceae bacterium]|jgi:twitching motility protein PilT|nr:type IV pilus twitching motility protein PilT [Solirubrobacteraceae bacterium]